MSADTASSRRGTSPPISGHGSAASRAMECAEDVGMGIEDAPECVLVDRVPTKEDAAGRWHQTGCARQATGTAGPRGVVSGVVGLRGPGPRRLEAPVRPAGPHRNGGNVTFTPELSRKPGRRACPAPGNGPLGSRTWRLAALVLTVAALQASAQPTQPCPSPKVLCNGKCVDLSTNRRNCGACGHACAPGQKCVNGVCGAGAASGGGAGNCKAPKVMCNGKCVNLSINRENCGRAGRPARPVRSATTACAAPARRPVGTRPAAAAPETAGRPRSCATGSASTSAPTGRTAARAARPARPVRSAPTGFAAAVRRAVAARQLVGARQAVGARRVAGTRRAAAARRRVNPRM